MAAKFRCWQLNLKVVAQKTKTLPKTKSNGAAPAHTRSEERRKRGRDNVVAD